MIARSQYLAAFIREGERGRFNILLLVKGYPASDETSAENGIALGEAVIRSIQMMTPKQVMNLFPVKKDFDGERFGWKDYFHTRRVVEEYGLDRKIENAVDFLWDYQNDDLFRFVAEYLCFCGKIYREQTGRNMAQDGMEAAHIPYAAFTRNGLFMVYFDGDMRVEMPYLPMWRELGLM